MLPSKITIFCLLNFIVAFISDLGLNFLASTKSSSLLHKFVPNAILVLKPYFHGQIFKPAVLAGLTILFALAFTMVVNYGLFGFWYPTYGKQLLRFCSLAFPLGYIIDILIRDLQIFGPTLDRFYEVAGAGFWGALAFLFSILLSYAIMQKYKMFI